MSSSTSDGSSSTAFSRSRSSSPFQRAMTSVAAQLPIAFVSARPSLITRSMPTITAIPDAMASGVKNSPPKACSDAASVTSPAPVTPAAPST